MSEKLLTTEEVAHQLQIHEKTIQRWLKDGKLKGIKLGRFWRVEQKDLDEFLEQHRSTN